MPLSMPADQWLTSNPLPTPPQLSAETLPLEGEKHFVLKMLLAKHDFHPNLKNIPVFAYNGIYPGPTIEAKVNEPIRVSWKNELVDTTTSKTNLTTLFEIKGEQGMEDKHMMTLAHNVVHLHGAHVPWSSDGYPDHVFHPREGRYYRYPNDQAAATLWYHDHTMNVTRLNVYAGLFGLYFLRDNNEVGKLPSGAQEIPLVLQDKSFSADGKKLSYDQQIDLSNPAKPSLTPEFIGDFPVVNGKVWPLANLAQRIYRLRICNGANTRFFDLSLTHANDKTKVIDLHVIGTEGGFLTSSIKTPTLTIAPGERYDVLIDLRTLATNQELILRNSADTPAGPVTPECAELLKIIVAGPADSADIAFAPALVIPPPRANLPVEDITAAEIVALTKSADKVVITKNTQTLKIGTRKIPFRRFSLVEYKIVMPTTVPKGLASPTVLINGKDWDTAKPINVKFGDYELWEFINMTPDAHPMHIHLVQFKALSRRKVHVKPGTKTPKLPEPKVFNGYMGANLPLQPYEEGFKDTVRCLHNQATRVLMKFDGYRGDYVYHCHILEHEDMGMMFKIKVE